MSNPIYNMLGNSGIINQFKQFRDSFRGDPKIQIQRMLNSGQISQDQYNRAVQQAQILQNMLNNVM